jgi:hypothetical protein
MPYLGRGSQKAIRQRFIFTQSSAGATSISGADDSNATLRFDDGEYVDVILNGITLAKTEYNTLTANTISGLAALSSGDVLQVTVYDMFNVADSVRASTGGTFTGGITVNGAVTASSTLSVTGALTATAGASSNAISLQSANFKMTDLTTNAFYRTGTFTPTFNPFTVGNGSVFGNYIRIGDLVHYNFGFAFGSSSSIGGDIYNISGLPFAIGENISGSTDSYVPFPFICWDNGAQWRQGIGQGLEGATYIVYPSITAVANSYISASNPFTWATGDSLTFTGTYTTSDA